MFCLTRRVLFLSASNFFPSIAVLCNKMRPQVKIATDVYIFRLCHSINGPLRKYELSSVGTKDHVSRFWLINFDPYCLFRFVVVMIDYLLSRNVLLFSCNPIGQLCLGGRGYSSRTVMPYVILNDTF